MVLSYVLKVKKRVSYGQVQDIILFINLIVWMKIIMSGTFPNNQTEGHICFTVHQRGNDKQCTTVALAALVENKSGKIYYNKYCLKGWSESHSYIVDISIYTLLSFNPINKYLLKIKFFGYFSNSAWPVLNGQQAVLKLVHWNWQHRNQVTTSLVTESKPYKIACFNWVRRVQKSAFIKMYFYSLSVTSFVYL